MDSFRLLTRGSSVKIAPTGSQLDRIRPSVGIESLPSKDQSLSGKKRKREDIESDSHGIGPTLSTDEIKKIQRLHKVKITDLKARQNEDAVENRKAQKEASRLFPQPLLKFSALRDKDTNHALLENVFEQGYRDPTEVQLATIPLLMPSQSTEPDLLTVAPTGSGKTLAFMIPLIDYISKSHRNDVQDKSSRQVGAVILAPTKELVVQIVNEGRKLAARTGVRITAFRKGMRLHENFNSAQNSESDDESEDEDVTKDNLVKADILVATPLSFLNAITPANSDGPLPLPQIHHLILDEADILLDPLFRSQTMSIWSACSNPSLRISLWSATIGSNIEELTITTIKARQKALKIKSKDSAPLLRCIIGLKDSSLPNITHKLIYASTETGKLTALRQLIRPPPSNIGSNPKQTPSKPTPLLRPPFLIFTQTINRAEALYSELQYDIPPSISNTTSPSSTTTPRIALLHSSLPTHQRNAIMASFRSGKTWILITTDLLSRGIDLRGLNGTVNYDIPTTPASYVHRAGRTGRAGREGGICITLYTKDDVPYLRPIVNVIAKSQKLHHHQYHQQQPLTDNSNSSAEEAVPSWLLASLPKVTQSTRQEIKQRGIAVRRAVKESDDKAERRRKGRNVIGTKSGFEKQAENRRRGMVEGSKRRSRSGKGVVEEGEDSDGDVDGEDFSGFD